jgi:hypothetical protein
MPQVNEKPLGSFRFEHMILFDTLRFGQSELKSGDNARRLARANAARSYMNGSNDCRDIETLWEPELSFERSKQDICELAQIMKTRNVALLQLSLGRVQPESGFAKQEIFLRFAMTEEGQAKLEKFLLSRDDESVTVATGTLNFLRIVRNDGGAPVTAVEFQYEVVPNVWAHFEKGLARNTLPPERKIGTAAFRKSSEKWQLIDTPSF